MRTVTINGKTCNEYMTKPMLELYANIMRDLTALENAFKADEESRYQVADCKLAREHLRELTVYFETNPLEVKDRDPFGVMVSEMISDSGETIKEFITD